MPSKVLMIGLDAMEGSLVRKWIADDKLPNLKKLMQHSQWADTVNPPGFIGSITVWPTFFTASDASVHGRYAYRQLVPGTYTTRITSPLDVTIKPFWEPISDAGKKVALLDMPSAPISDKLNGVQVSYWGAHDLEDKFQTSPPELADKFQTQYGCDPIGSCDYGGHGPKDQRTFRDEILDRTATRLKFSCDLLVDADWDLFCTVFSEPHCIGHQSWHLHDANHPRHDAQLAAELGDPILDVYVSIDKAIGELIAHAGKDARIMVFSSQGMGPVYSHENLITQILEAHEPAGTSSSGAKLFSFLTKLRGKIPTFLHAPFGAFKNKLRNNLLANDWASRKCFLIPPSNGSTSCLRLNIIGRDPQGRIQPGAELEQFVSDITNELLALTAPGTNQKLVKEVLRSAEIYEGEYLHAFPDLLVEWNNDSSITGTQPSGIDANRSGDHTPGGFVIVSGVSNNNVQTVSTCDLAPTLTAWLGVNNPDFQGKPVAEWV